MIKAGIDFSITSPAICIGRPGETPTFHAFRKAKKQVSCHPNLILYDYPEWSTQEERFDKLATWAVQIVADADIIQMEAYAMRAMGNVFDIGEATGVLKHKLYVLGKKFERLIVPSEAKKFATGKGNSKKNQMAISYLKEPCAIDVFGILGKEFDENNENVASPMSDIIDAYWMWKFHE